jgi:hypothetical protein
MHFPVPARCTFRPRWQIAPFEISAGVAKAHRHDRHSILVVKRIAVDCQPVAQTLAAAVIEREASLVHPGSRRLAGNQEP